MNKSYLKQMPTYINKVYDIGQKINTLKDKRIKSPVKISTITFCSFVWIYASNKKF